MGLLADGRGRRSVGEDRHARRCYFRADDEGVILGGEKNDGGLLAQSFAQQAHCSPVKFDSERSPLGSFVPESLDCCIDVDDERSVGRNAEIEKRVHLADPHLIGRRHKFANPGIGVPSPKGDSPPLAGGLKNVYPSLNNDGFDPLDSKSVTKLGGWCTVDG
jgi:hypothetical protein